MRTSLSLVLTLAASIALAEAQTNAPGTAVSTVMTNEATIEAAYQALLLLDNIAMMQIQELMKNWNAQQGSDLATKTEEELRREVQSKIESVKKAYREFLKADPQHVRAMIAYGSFLSDIQEEPEGLQWWLRAKELDPKNAAVRNNLANYYGHRGEPKRAIEEYEAAIQLQPNEPMYHHNLGNILYLFRRDAAALKDGTEAEMLERALACFRKARELEPNNYDYAVGYAETFYGMKSPNWQRALEAWEYCLKLDLTPLQRDQVYTHLARVHIRLGNTAKAKEQLAQVKSEQFQDVRQRLTDIANHQGDTPRDEELSPDSPKAR